MNEKFTPGPWRKEGNRVYPTTEEGKIRHCGGPICSVNYNCFADRLLADKNEKEASFDAALVSAAPEMYDWLNWLIENDMLTIVNPNDREKIKLALKKARGES